MPNTLAHITVNGLSTKAVYKISDWRWILLGTIIPDIPWIIQRATKIIYPEVNGYDLRLYVIVQATFFFCMILSLWFSQFSKNQIKTFVILAGGSLLHLLLDATQIKWGNGVHLFAPFSWKLLNFGFYWPESVVTYTITILGLGIIYFYRKEIFTPVDEIKLRNVSYHLYFLPLILFYFLMPFYYMSSAEQADNHYVKTLRSIETRTGKHIEFDRRKVFNRNNETFLETFADENIKLKSQEKLTGGTYSIKGIFENPTTIKVLRFHKHNAVLRDGASYLGLLLVLFAWILPFIRRKFN